MSEALTLPGRSLPVEWLRVGQGRALVYLHGAFGMEWSAPLIDELSRDFSVVAPHMPGYGASEGLERIRSFYDLSVWLDEVLDALNLPEVLLVGHDFGGAAAAEYAALFRGRVSGLALITPYGLWPKGEPLPDIFGLTPGALTKLLYADPTGAPANAFNAKSSDKAQETADILRRRQALIAAAKLMWPIPDKGLRHRLYRISAPTLVVGGTQDRLMDETYIREFTGSIGGARMSLLNAGHMIPQEAPEQAGAAIRAMFAG